MWFLFRNTDRNEVVKELRPNLGQVFRELARRKGCEIEEGHVMVDHVHMLISIPPKYAVSQVIGFQSMVQLAFKSATYFVVSDDLCQV